jgi:hypothetical protein
MKENIMKESQLLKRIKTMKAKNQFFVPHNVLEEEKFLNMSLSAQILFIHLCKLKNRL